MNPLMSSPTSVFHRSQPSLDDVEMLQTDVMRFFAILCLCLMAIFALVKALPISPPADRPTIAAPPDLSAEAASLEKKIAVLKEKLTGIQTRLKAAAGAIRKSKAQAADATVREQKTLSRLSKKRAELASVLQTLKEARNDITAREEVLARLVQDISEKRRIREELQAQIENEKQKYDNIQARLDQAATKLYQTNPPPHQAPPTKKPPNAAPATPPVRKGYTLRFASDNALDTLINRGKVQFYALAGQKAWKLGMVKGKPVYTTVKIPAELYEMDTTTVPADYTASFSRQVAAFGQGNVTWGVTLPDQTANAIAKRIQDREGGDLIIMPSGEVLLK